MRKNEWILERMREQEVSLLEFLETVRVSHVTFYRWVKGTQTPFSKRLGRIARLLEMEREELKRRFYQF